MKKFVTRLPLIGPIARMGYRSIYRGIKATSDQSMLQRLSNTTYPQGKTVAHVLHQLTNSLPRAEHDLITRIEQERKRLLLQTAPLVDDSLGKAGLYDKGVTIKAACEASKPPKASLLLYFLIRIFKPLNVIELGTNIGISAAYQALALQLNSQNGKLTSLEVSPYRLRVAKEIHKNLGLDNITYVEGLFSETLDDALRKSAAVDFAFIDGHHQYEPTLHYFQSILNHSLESIVLVFDDIRWSYGMKRAWSKIQSHEKIEMSVDLHSMGVCVGVKGPVAQRYQFGPIYSPLF